MRHWSHGAPFVQAACGLAVIVAVKSPLPLRLFKKGKGFLPIFFFLEKLDNLIVSFCHIFLRLLCLLGPATIQLKLSLGATAWLLSLRF